MDPELFWYFDQGGDSEFEGIQEPRAAYSADLAQNDLIAWKNAIELAVVIHEISRNWPGEEMYGLTSQIRRASVSVAANIAEGQGREGVKEFLYHLSIAQGSLREVETHLVIARRYGYVSENEFARAAQACLNSRKPLRGLINHLRKDRPDGK